MKNRKSFVSNSSSTSFIVFDDSIIPDGVGYTTLGILEINRLNEEGYNINHGEPVYLTEYVGDAFLEFFYEYNKDKGHNEVKENVIEYHEGGHGYPYDEDMYDEIADNIWLRKTDEEIEKIIEEEECPSCQSDDVDIVHKCRECGNTW